MSSIMVISSDTKAKKDKILEVLKNLELEYSENNPDLIFIEPEKDKKSIGIQLVKNLVSFTQEKPMSHKNKAVVVEKGELLTEQAQNSLLKILEEHPSFCNIILGVRTESDLLGTVQSRCKKIKLLTKTPSNEQNFDFINKPIGDRFVWVLEECEKEREEVINDLRQIILQLRENFINGGTDLKVYKKIELIERIAKDLEDTNVTLKLALEYLAVKI